VSVFVNFSYAELSWVFDMTQQDLRRRLVDRVDRSRTFKIVDEFFKTLFEHVVAQIHDEVVFSQKLVSDQHTVRQAKRLVLRNISDFDTELAAVTDRRFDFFARRTDNDANLANARSRHGFNPVKQDWFVSNRHQLFSARMSNWP